MLLSDIANPVIAKNKAPERVNIYEVMSKPVVSVDPDMDIRYCARLFENMGLARAPVIDNRKVIGVAGYTDIVLRGDHLVALPGVTAPRWRPLCWSILEWLSRKRRHFAIWPTARVKLWIKWKSGRASAKSLWFGSQSLASLIKSSGGRYGRSRSPQVPRNMASTR